MPKTTHPDLDLAQTIRPGLDILANEIVIALKKRTRFHQNLPIYKPGLVLNDTNLSLLSHVLGRIENCHAELGRYTYAVQDAFTEVADVELIIDRMPATSPVLAMPSGVGNRIIQFYSSWVLRACPEGSNSDHYGETVTSDVNALLAIMERVNLGKPVAEAKFLSMPEHFLATGGDRQAMLALLVHADREAAVLELARELARHYVLPEEHAVEFFEFMIATTIDIEVDYLRLRIRDES